MEGFAKVIPVALTESIVTTNVAISEAAWTVGTTYADGAIARRLFADGLQHRVESLVGSNLGNDPALDDGTKWLDLGPVNAHAMFDDTSTTTTVNATSIDVDIALPTSARADCVYLAGLSARTVRIQVEDPSAGLVHDQTYSLADVSNVLGWYAWFFAPVRYKSELLVTGLPSSAGATVSVTVNNPGGDAECGLVVMGQAIVLGQTRWDAAPENKDYSRWVEDDFGGRKFQPGAYRKMLACDVLVETRLLDGVTRELRDSNQSPRLYIANDTYTSMTIFGSLKWRASLTQDRAPDYFALSVQCEGNT